MEPINDGIHNCKECRIYKKDGMTCSLQPDLDVSSCKYCDTRMCCRSPFLVLMECELNTILDKVEEGEYIECKGIIPFNIKTRYCKHMDVKTMTCKVYNQRPIGCRTAGEDCLGNYWARMIKELHENNVMHKS